MPHAWGRTPPQAEDNGTMTLTAKILGVAIPVIVVTTFCLSVPFILIIADVVILGGAVVAFVSQRRAPVALPAEDLPELE
jgi:hypothetical protein